VYKWILPSLGEILAEGQSTVSVCSPGKAEQQWNVSLAATSSLLLNTFGGVLPQGNLGLVLTAPVPLFGEPKLTQSLQTVTFTAKPFNPLALMPFQMPTPTTAANVITPHESILPLLPADPLATEKFCLVFTDKFMLVLVLTEDSNGSKTFSFSFEPEIVQQAWRSLGARVMLTNPDFFVDLDKIVQNYSKVTTDYRIVMQFGQLLLQEMPENGGGEEHKNRETGENMCFSSPHLPISSVSNPHSPHSSRPDVELLQAFAHEVRTPLTTIRTMTRLLLKRQDLPEGVTKRLAVIDHECTEQIDRMELLFKAAELENSTSVKSTRTQLTPMCLDEILVSSIPRWQQTASRRNLTLDVVLPQKLPTVVSNPMMLDRVLTGLMENFTRSLPPGSHIQVQVMTAGDQLKLQLLPLPQGRNNSIGKISATPPIRKALGELLMFQPETGVISLNLAATKHLFQAIGGKLIVRERPQHGEVLTIFLPLQEELKIKN
jgi:hypothetical protein